jgi:hypothetical protein
MTYSTYGYGRSYDAGSIVTFGLGRTLISPIKNVTIEFDLELQAQYVKQLDTYENIFLSTNLTIEQLNTLTSNPNIILGTQLDLTEAKQLDSELNIIFDTDLDLASLGQLTTTAQANIGLGLELIPQGFTLDPGRRKQNVYIIPEELRFLPVFMELRKCTVSEDERTEIINYEDRTIIVIEGD